MGTHNKSSQSAVRMDMLHGSLLNKILLFSLPLAASSILQQLFNSVDVAQVFFVVWVTRNVLFIASSRLG